MVKEQECRRIGRQFYPSTSRPGFFLQKGESRAGIRSDFSAASAPQPADGFNSSVLLIRMRLGGDQTRVRKWSNFKSSLLAYWKKTNEKLPTARQWETTLIKLSEKEPGKAEKKASGTEKGAGMQVGHALPGQSQPP